MIKYFDINRPGYSVKCKLFCESPREIESCILFLHGFGGHKDTKAAERFAESVQSKMKKTAVLVFDWPAHGKDVRKKIAMEDCMTYLSMVIAYAKDELHAARLFAYGTSFGGYMALRYIHEKGNPFARIALRCPAVNMYDSISTRIMTPENRELLARGREALTGFDRKARVDAAFIESLRSCDIRAFEYLDWAEDILIVHGDRDEIIPLAEAQKFADDNVIECVVIPGADHRFQNLDLLKLAHSHMVQFFMEAK